MRKAAQKLRALKIPNNLFRVAKKEIEIEEGQMLFTNFESSIKHMVRFYDQMK